MSLNSQLATLVYNNVQKKQGKMKQKMKAMLLVSITILINTSNSTLNLMIFPMNNEGNICERMTNGCSVPTILLKGRNREYSKLFKDSCNKHDICYCCVSNISINIKH